MPPPGLEDLRLLVVFDLFLSIITLALVYLFWRERSETEAKRNARAASQNPHGEWTQIKKGLEAVGEHCDKIVSAIPRMAKTSAPGKPPLASEMNQVLSSFRKWSGAVTNSRGSRPIDGQQLQQWEFLLVDICQRASKPPGPQPGRPDDDNIRTEARQIVKCAVNLTDKDLGHDSGSEVQSALEELVKSARLKLVSPKKGEPFLDPRSNRKIKVGKVLTRGLCDQNNKWILIPEIDEKR